MSAPIGPGDWVECVDGRRRPVGGADLDPAPEVKVGGVYRVTSIRPGHAFRDGLDRLILVERPGLYFNGQPHCYAAIRFRPLYRPSEKLLRDLMEPIPAEPEKVTQGPSGEGIVWPADGSKPRV